MVVLIGSWVVRVPGEEVLLRDRLFLLCRDCFKIRDRAPIKLELNVLSRLRSR
ncbi:hypothetical protein IQ249_21540 [Lusitaniella coriacea LEGE 07157]|uniref:Uncharacterized protein n=1 Tax=Lusitaniella coriacea LEGE 07157 TaxID=945747 RepID=A0A8J7DZX3_9CYAN|nr:hypothetical protein [Lusitaniella coriacea]MBE9118478.1 hypothetical protein [Lusitaniella coriacea LEGE 07157]